MTNRKLSAGVFLLLLLLFSSLGLMMKYRARSSRYEARLREVYDGAVLSALRQMEDIQLALSKALLTREAGAEAQYLNQVSAGAAQVQRSLALLPLSHAATQSAMKFANQAADYSSVLLKGDGLDEKDAARLNALISACGEYAAALAQHREALAAQAAAGGEAFYPAAAQAETPAYDSAVSYPTLIYDGPFSDALQTGQALSLGNRQITREEAVQIARVFAGEERVRSAVPGTDTGGSIPCWGVTLYCGDITLQAAVTRTGGKILWMAPDAADFPMEKSVEECRENALQFLAARGYENMEPTYFQTYQGVTVISFAATQGTTLLYPDMIKVQLRMDTAQVVGVEARNYLMNHTARGLLIPRLTEEEAQKSVGERLAVSSARLCLIPTDAGERLCYEFKGEYLGRTYLSYINAADGRQEQLFKVVESQTGLEAV